MAEQVTLRDGDLLLRPWQPGDVAAVHRACQDPDIQRWTTVPAPYTEADVRRFVTELSPAGWADDSSYTFAVLSAGDLVASIELSHRSGRFVGETGAIGYWTAPWARGRGHMTRAVRRVCRWAFEDRGIERITWHAEVGNAASRRVAERCGFRVEGVARGLLVRDGRRVDAWAGSLLSGGPTEGTPTEPLLAPPALTGDRLHLRPPELRDVDAIVAGCADPELQRWVPIPAPYTAADARAFVDGQVAGQWDGRFDLAVTRRDTRQLVGMMGLHRYRPGWLRAEIGYWIDVRHRRQGYATEAVRLLSAWALGERGLHRLDLLADAGNVASQGVAARAGFLREGIERESVRGRDGDWRSMIRFARVTGS